MVRRDLPLGQIVSQTIHASDESAANWQRDLGLSINEYTRCVCGCLHADHGSDNHGVRCCDGCGAEGCGGAIVSIDPALPEDTHAVALEAKSEKQLLDVSAALTEKGIPHVLVREPDEPYCGQAMALGCYPTRDRESIRPILKKYQCIR